MIREIKIKNLQSHEDSTLVFSPNVNVIIGTSNSGKTAILRALNWVKNNRPLGIENLASHWIVDGKGKLDDEIEVKLTTDSAEVTRKRTKSENQYIVDDLILNVVKTDVPEQVTSMLKLTDTSIQNQHDSPFLLSKSNGEVAKFFNKVVNLEIIDKVLSNAESEKRKASRKIEDTIERISQLDKEIVQYDWLKNIDKVIKEIEVLETEVLDSKEKVKDLNNIIGDLMKEIEVVHKSDILRRLSFLIEKSEKKQILLEKMKNDNALLESKLAELKKELSVILRKEEIEALKQVINELRDLERGRINLNPLMKDITDLKEYNKSVSNYNSELINLKSKLPDVCPMCGNKYRYFGV
jgi:exonuclease SbcC